MTQLPQQLKSLYPFQKNLYLEVPGGKLHYLDEGDGSQAILMVHGNPTWSFYYRNLVLGLRDRFRCIVLDHIGCGLSSKPQAFNYTLENHIENACRLIESLNVKSLHLIVHDWGGPIGLGVAMRYLDRIEKIVVLNTSGFLSQQIPLRINLCRIPILGEMAIRGFNLFARAATHMAVNKNMNSEVRRGYLFPYNNWKNRIATYQFVQDIPMKHNHRTHAVMRRIQEGLLGLKDHPMLICWGGRDFCFNDTFLKEWEKRFPKAEVHYFEQAGHYILEDAGDAVLKLLQSWL